MFKSPVGQSPVANQTPVTPAVDEKTSATTQAPAPKPRVTGSAPAFVAPGKPLVQRGLQSGPPSKGQGQAPLLVADPHVLPPGSKEYGQMIQLPPSKPRAESGSPTALRLPDLPVDDAPKATPPGPTGPKPASGQTLTAQLANFDKTQLQGTGFQEPDSAAQARLELTQDANRFVTTQKTTTALAPRFVELRLDAQTAEALTTLPARQALDTLGQALLLGDLDKANPALQLLGQALAREVATLPLDEQQALLVGRGDTFIDGLLGFVDDARPGVPTSAKALNPVQREIMDRLIDHIGAQLPNHVEADGRTLVMNGKTFTRGDKLGQGSFGEVHLYTAKDGDKLAVKVPRQADSGPGATGRDRRARQPAAEARTMLQAQGTLKSGPNDTENDATHVLPLRGVARTASGEVWLATEFAEFGSASQLMMNIEFAKANGARGPAELDSGKPALGAEQALRIQLTMLRDVLMGARQLQELQGLVHFDLRGDNILVDKDGSLLIGDFGQARPSQQGQVDLRTLGDIPRLTSSPELMGSGAPVSDKTDIWSLGVLAHQLLFGTLPEVIHGVESLDDVPQALQQFGKDTDARAYKPATPPGYSVTSGTTPAQQNQASLGLTSVQKLINSMLHPDPAQRPTLQALLETSLLSDPALGGPEIRSQIQQLAQGTGPLPVSTYVKSPATLQAPAPSVYFQSPVTAPTQS